MSKLTDEQIKRAVGASDEYWASSKLFIIGIARAIEDALSLPCTTEQECTRNPACRIESTCKRAAEVVQASDFLDDPELRAAAARSRAVARALDRREPLPTDGVPPCGTQQQEDGRG